MRLVDMNQAGMLLIRNQRVLAHRAIARVAGLSIRQASTAAPVLFEQSGNVGIVTLNVPQRMNAMTVDMGEHLVNVLDRVDVGRTNCLVITGAGEKAFSAGGDFEFLRARSKDTGSRNSMLMKRFYDMYLGAIRRVPVPTIAAMNGSAVGAGLCFALGCDLRIASKTAKIGVSFTAIGLHPGMGATYMLPRLVGPQLAAKMCLTGELMSGTEAAAAGLVLEAVDEDKVMPRAMELANKIAANGPVAVRSTVRSLRLQTEGPSTLDAALWREADAQSYCYSGPDLAEGVEAQAGKRKPNFTQVEKYEW